MKFSELCGPLQIYIVLSLLGFLLQLYNVYITRNMSWIRKNLTFLVISVIMTLVVFVFWGRVIHSLCETKNRELAWILIFFPFVMLILYIILFIAGALVDVTASEVKRLI
mgnify:CR=1 FL=1